MEYFAGLDISMDETHVCVLDREGVARETEPCRAPLGFRTGGVEAAIRSKLPPMTGLAPSSGTDWTDHERGEIRRLEALCRNLGNWELGSKRTDRSVVRRSRSTSRHGCPSYRPDRSTLRSRLARPPALGDRGNDRSSNRYRSL